MSGPLPFVCTHRKGWEDHSAEIIDTFRHGSGNARADLVAQARAEAEAVRPEDVDSALDEVLRIGESWSDYLERIGRDAMRIGRSRAQLGAALDVMNSHEVRCPTCSVTERLSGSDMEVLGLWAKRHDQRFILLLETRAILRLAKKESSGDKG